MPDHVDGQVAAWPAHGDGDGDGDGDGEINEKLAITEKPSKIDSVEKEGEVEVHARHGFDDFEGEDDGIRADDTVIITGTDVAVHLLSMRDDHDPAITVRSLILATILSVFQAVMSQIYHFKPTTVVIQGTFIVLMAYFLGNGWAALLPRGDVFEARWRARGGQGPAPFWMRALSVVNHGPWGLKEHAICSITATSASHASASVAVFAAQDLFYDVPLTSTTIVLSTLSIGLFGYGLAGLIKPIGVWHVDAVYWQTLPTVKTLQGLHWQHVKESKPLRWFWYSFGGMFAYEFFPAYMMPWLNSVSVPCLASMKATGETAARLTRVFGGAMNNEGLGLFNISFDWQYLNSDRTALPLKLQWHMLAGYLFCYAAMLGVFYTNAWEALSQPFMSTRLRTVQGGAYPTSKVFTGGMLNQTALEQYGPPRMAGTLAYGMFMANAAIGALITHCFVFWGGDVWRACKRAREGRFDDPHHVYMAKTYRDAPWWWSAVVLVASFLLGLVVVVRENITLPAWAYMAALLLGCFIAPLSTLLYSRYGSGVATNNLSKMVAGLLLPGLPLGNMYFAAWSHNVISATLSLCNDFKLGEYLKVPPRAMFLTQVYGTVLGGFVNYAVMTAIVKGNRNLLVNSDGNSSWSGAAVQAYNTNAVTWALAKYMYNAGALYAAVPWGIAVGAAAVVAHKIFHRFVPYIRNFDVAQVNMPQFIQYAGVIPYSHSQTSVIWTHVMAGLYVQYYLRNRKPRIFKDYMFLVTAAFDGASLTALFVLSFAVFGAGGPSVPFPKWWGNNVDGNYDFCPQAGGKSSGQAAPAHTGE